MMKTVLKTLVISFGGGLALGAGMRLAQGPTKPRREPGVDLDPLLLRLKNVEGRITEMEQESGAHVEPPMSAAPLPSEVLGQSLVAFEARLASQLNDVEQIRSDIRRVDERLADLDSQLPVLVQSTVDVRFQAVEKKLQQEFEQAQTRSMAAFVDTLQSKVVDRISTLETNLVEQSQAIAKLRDASQRSDENLQKMLAGIERLVDQSKAPPPPPAPVSVAPPVVPVAVPRESPASVYEAASAIGRKEPVVPHDGAQARTKEFAEPPAAAKPAPQTPEVFSKPRYELPADTPILAVVPEIPTADTPEMVYIKVSADEIPAPQSATASSLDETAVESVAGPAVELPKPVAASVTEMPRPAAGSAAELPAPEPLKPQEPQESYEWVNKIGLELLAPRPKPRIGWRIPLVIGLAAGIILIVGLLYTGMLQHFFESGAMPQTSTLASAAPATAEPAPAQTAKSSDSSAQLELAREYQRRKDWTKAESAYRTILETNPDNRDAAIGLSDVLYQEQKYEESAAVLNKLRSAKSQ